MSALTVTLGADITALKHAMAGANELVAASAKRMGKLTGAGLAGLGKGGAAALSKGFDVAGVAFKASIGAAMAGGAAAVGVGMKSVTAAANFEQTKVAFATLIGDAAKAEATLAKLRELGAQTPFEFPELADAGRKLIAFGESADSVPETLRRIGDVSASVQAPINEIAELYGKARVQGRLFAEDINQLTGRGIPIIGQLARQFGVSDSEVKKLVESGKVGFPAIEQAFIAMTSQGGQFAGMMEAQSKTTSGLFSTLKDTINEVFLTLGTPINDALGPMLKEAIGFAQALAPLAAEAGAKIKEAVQFVIATFKSGQLFELVGGSLKLAFAESVNFLWATLRGAIAAAGQYVIEAFRTAVMWFEVLTTADFWAGMGNALIGIGMSFIALIQKGMAEALEIARPLAELFGKSDKIDAAQATLRESAGIIDGEAAKQYAKAGGQLGPVADKIARQYQEAGEHISNRFRNAFANTAEVIDSSGYRKQLGDTIRNIHQAMPDQAGKPVKQAAPAKPETPGGNGRATAKAMGIGDGNARQLGGFAQSMNALFGRSANAGLIEENKRHTDWLKKIHDNTKPKPPVEKPKSEAVFA